VALPSSEVDWLDFSFLSSTTAMALAIKFIIAILLRSSSALMNPGSGMSGV
jgi:hypothetical protein